MNVRIEKIEKIVLKGICEKYPSSLTAPIKLWQEFYASLKEHPQTLPQSFYSVSHYTGAAEKIFVDFPSCKRWAAVQNNALNDNLEFEELFIETGIYAIFSHVGTAQDFPQTIQEFIQHWLPNSGYQIREGMHFEILPPGYNPVDPKAKEEVYIPVRKAEP